MCFTVEYLPCHHRRLFRWPRQWGRTSQNSRHSRGCRTSSHTAQSDCPRYRPCDHCSGGITQCTVCVRQWNLFYYYSGHFGPKSSVLYVYTCIKQYYNGTSNRWHLYPEIKCMCIKQYPPLDGVFILKLSFLFCIHDNMGQSSVLSLDVSSMKATLRC